MIELSERDKALIMKYLSGGVMLGTGLGLGQAGLNYAGFLRERAKAKTRTDKDDDTLYVTVPTQKQGALGAGLAMAGGSLSLIAANALVNKIYQRLIKKPELQAELDSAQRRHLNVLTGDIESGEGVEKEAAAHGKGMSGLEFATGLPLTIALLTALASGTLGYQALNQTFPAVRKPQSALPSRVRIVRQGQSDDGAGDLDKEASSDSVDEADVSAAWDWITHMYLAGKAKMASADPGWFGGSDVEDLVYAVADGRFDEIKQAVADMGINETCEMIKGASEVSKVSDVALDLAVTLLVDNPLLGPAFRLKVAAEMLDLLPNLERIGAEIEGLDAAVAVKQAAAMGRLYRMATVYPLAASARVSKEASAKPAGIDAVYRLILKNQLEHESAGDRKGLADRVASNQSVSGSASETGKGKESDGMSGGTAPRDVPELVMGV